MFLFGPDIAHMVFPDAICVCLVKFQVWYYGNILDFHKIVMKLIEW